MLVASISSAMQSLGWVVVMIALQTFMFSLCITQYITDHKILESTEKMKQEQWELEHYFGTVGRSMLSLYEVISEGLHWSKLMEPVDEYCSGWAWIMFVMYSGFAVLILMNVITGVFTNTAIMSAEAERKQVLASMATACFADLQEDGSSMISEADFTDNLHEPRMQELLSYMEVAPADAVRLYELLTEGKSKHLSADELVSGCLHLNVHAKSLDVALLRHEFRQVSHRAAKQLQSIRDDIKGIKGTLHKRKPKLDSGPGPLMSPEDDSEFGA